LVVELNEALTPLSALSFVTSEFAVSTSTSYVTACPLTWKVCGPVPLSPASYVFRRADGLMPPPTLLETV
jgi:hypothetical protein